MGGPALRVVGGQGVGDADGARGALVGVDAGDGRGGAGLAGAGGVGHVDVSVVVG